MDFGNHKFNYKITGFPNLELPLTNWESAGKPEYLETQTIRFHKRKFIRQRNTESPPVTYLLWIQHGNN